MFTVCVSIDNTYDFIDVNLKQGRQRRSLDLTPRLRGCVTGWMEQLPQDQHSLPLQSLAIPGSHNSFTYTLSSRREIAPSFMDYQTLRIVHGLYERTIRELLKDIKDFTSARPKEVVILVLTPYGKTNYVKNAFLTPSAMHIAYHTLTGGTLEWTLGRPATQAATEWIKRVGKRCNLNIVLADYVDYFEFIRTVIKLNFEKCKYIGTSIKRHYELFRRGDLWERLLSSLDLRA
ncbi:uncharacterized protein LOC116620867 [Nematostella vectensis]|uniref:uncharacterized protein LOC116620867 n=1 Tax=Nematostella vectensis TaxID=45351 RepID=UPI0020775C86|nr:uncharacterized protein LOC116620867 [Nematostella vectensis]